MPLLKCGWDAAAIADIAAGTISAFDRVGNRPAWVLGNHEKSRLAARFGGGNLGRERARAAALMRLSLPGHAYVYAGAELGLDNAFVPDSARMDPIFHRTDGARLGRDGVRVPLPWEAAAPGWARRSSRSPPLGGCSARLRIQRGA